MPTIFKLTQGGSTWSGDTVKPTTGVVATATDAVNEFVTTVDSYSKADSAAALVQETVEAMEAQVETVVELMKGHGEIRGDDAPAPSEEDDETITESEFREAAGKKIQAAAVKLRRTLATAVKESMTCEGRTKMDEVLGGLGVFGSPTHPRRPPRGEWVI